MRRFVACSWPVSSLSSNGLAEIRGDAAGHPEGFALLASCQRIEVYSFSEQAARCGCPAPFHWAGVEALQHLAGVAAGLHSVVLGEEQILGQVRAALEPAEPAVRGLGRIAVAAARRFRQDSALHQTTGQLLDSALALAKVPAGGPLTVVGAGAVGRLIAERALALGFSPVAVVARQLPAGEWFSRGDMRFVPFAAMHAAPIAEVVVTCLGSTSFELPPTSLPVATRLIVDLGTPRNVGEGATTPLLTIADLAASEGEREEQPAWLDLRARLHDILDERLARAAEGATSHVGRVRLEVERVRQAELVRIQRLHPELKPETVDTITRALINQIFHRPSQRLRTLEDADLAERLAALFAPDPAPRAPATQEVSV
ncbi:MAG: hypothetical protein ACRDG3_08990 [Tepidiformaceae bacterium]